MANHQDKDKEAEVLNLQEKLLQLFDDFLEEEKTNDLSLEDLDIDIDNFDYEAMLKEYESDV